MGGGADGISPGGPGKGQQQDDNNVALTKESVNVGMATNGSADPHA